LRFFGIAVAALSVGIGLPSALVGWGFGPSSEVASLGADPSQSARVDAFSWSTMRPATNVGVEFRFDVPTKTDCTFRSWAHGLTAGAGPDWTSLLLTPGSRVWSALTGDAPLQVHMEGVADTREVQASRSGDAWSVRSQHHRQDVAGPVSWFVASQRLAPAPVEAAASSLAFDVWCAAPFRVAGRLAASDVALFNDGSLHQGQSLHVLAVGGLARGESLHAAMTNADVRLSLGTMGNEGSLQVRTPSGVRDFDLKDAASWIHAEDGAGDYEVHLDCVCRGSFWGVLADLHPVDDPAVVFSTNS
jgi:hypothetical protein